MCIDLTDIFLQATCDLSGMFRRSASLAIPHLKSIAAITSVSLVQLGHTNCNVFLSHESQREIALEHFQDRFLTANRENGEKKTVLCVRKVCVFDVSQAVGTAQFAES